MDAIDLTGSGSEDDDPRHAHPSLASGPAPAATTTISDLTPPAVTATSQPVLPTLGFSSYAASPSLAAGAPGGESPALASSSRAPFQGAAAAAPSSSSTSPPTAAEAHGPLGQQSFLPPSASSSSNNISHNTNSTFPTSSSLKHSSSSASAPALHPAASSSHHLPSSSRSGFPSSSTSYPAVANSSPAPGDNDDVMVTGQSGPTMAPSFGQMLGSASAAAHQTRYPPAGAGFPEHQHRYHNGAGAGPSSSSRRDDAGSSAAAAIDVDSLPPSAAPRRPNPKKPVCIGAFMSRAIMLYPQSCAMAGCGPPQGSRWDLVNFRGVEMIRVKLKLRRAGTSGRSDEPWTTVNQDTIQVLTPDMRCYIGDLDGQMASHLIPMLERGLCRLEGFALRLQPTAPTYEIRINVMIFTLPSNINYIVDTLVSHKIFLLDPMPPYDPQRHSDHPEYMNGHGSGEIAYKLYLQSRSAQTFGYAERDKAKQVEVQRAQVDEVFKSIDNGMELEQTDPGPWIKTELFPHQRKALTFLLQGEQDWSSLKAARKNLRKLTGKKDTADGDNSRGSTPGEKEKAGGEKSEKDKAKEKEDNIRSLWEGQPDEKGRIKVFKNKVTGETIRGKRPKEAKGVILADDMGLGKTLSVVSLIAATRSAANQWHDKKLEQLSPVSDDESKPELPATVMTTKVFGMPDDAVVEGSKTKKRRRDKDVDESTRIRRSQLVKRSKATLLVCPMSTITNWEDQLREHWDGTVEVVGGQSVEKKKKDNKPVDKSDLLRVYIYHGTSRKADPRFLAEFDVVITSYSTLANEYSKQCASHEDDTSTPATQTTVNSDDDTKGSSAESPAKIDSEPPKPLALAQALNQSKKKGGGGRKKGTPEQSPLQSVDWFRVVLDEAHSIKSAATVACKACCYLEADRRIALTGTPIQNRIEDVWALFKFLRLSPIDDKEVFNKFIITPCKTGEQIGIARLQLIMRTCSLRRTKDTVTEEGKKILALPPRREAQVWLDLREDERQIYDQRLGEIKKEVDELAAKKQLTKNYAHVLQHLLRLRQTCDHVDLAGSGVAEEDYDGEIMGIDVALHGIERWGLNQPRALAVVCAAKDNDTCVCSDCGHDFSPFFPSVGLGGAEDDAIVKEEVKVEKGKKSTHPLLTRCLHIFCPGCFKRNTWPQWPKGTKGVMRHCMKCEKELKLDRDVADVIPPSELDDELAKRPAPSRKKWRRQPGEDLIMSTKMQYLHDQLMRLSKLNKHSPNFDPFYMGGDPNPAPRAEGAGPADEDELEVIETDDEGNPVPTKSIVFSQWTTMLDRIEDMLQEANIGYCRLDGTMTREARAEAMEALKTKQVEVMLVSTRAGGVGLNLTSASRAFLVDPYWNPSVEAQAIDRIHRLGQKRPVVALKLMIKNSVEDKMNDIQRKKANLANLSLKNMTRKELMEQKADELASLFS